MDRDVNDLVAQLLIEFFASRGIKVEPTAEEILNLDPDENQDVDDVRTL